MLRYLFVLYLILLQATTQAQKTFEGKLSMSISKGKEVTNRTIWVKNDQIRVEETIGNNPKKKTIYLIDGGEKKGYILSKDRKLYMETNPWQPAEEIDVTNPTVTETDNILQVQVEKWELMEKDSKRSITFYFSPNDFHFYRVMLRLLPERDYAEQLFLQLPLADDVMPMKAAWKDLNGQLIYQLNVTDLKSFAPPDQLFTIPEGYEKF